MTTAAASSAATSATMGGTMVILSGAASSTTTPGGTTSMAPASHHVVNDADGVFFTQSGEPWIDSIGGVIDVVLIVALILSGFSWFFHRKNAKRRQRDLEEASSCESYSDYSKRVRLSYQELLNTFEEIDKSGEEKQKRNDWDDLIE